MKSKANSYIKGLLFGGLIMPFAITSTHADVTDTSVAESMPWYQEYVGLTVLNSEGIELGTSKSITLDPMGNSGAKIVVDLKPDDSSPYKSMLIPLEFVGYFKEEQHMKLLKPMDSIREHISMRNYNLSEESEDTFALSTFSELWNWDNMLNPLLNSSLIESNTRL